MPKRPVGRPLLYENPSDLQKAVDDYFLKNPLPSICKLSYDLGFSDLTTFADYEARPRFTHIIKRARLYIASVHELNLFNKNCVGSLFWLKCNCGWKEPAQEVVQSGEIRVVVKGIAKLNV